MWLGDRLISSKVICHGTAFHHNPRSLNKDKSFVQVFGSLHQSRQGQGSLAVMHWRSWMQLEATEASAWLAKPQSCLSNPGGKRQTDAAHLPMISLGMLTVAKHRSGQVSLTRLLLRGSYDAMRGSRLECSASFPWKPLRLLWAGLPGCLQFYVPWEEQV